MPFLFPISRILIWPATIVFCVILQREDYDPELLQFLPCRIQVIKDNFAFPPFCYWIYEKGGIIHFPETDLVIEHSQ